MTIKRMTDDQKEAAAKVLCTLRGIDPDQIVQDRSPTNGGVTLLVATYSQAWRLALREIDDRENMDFAMAAGRIAYEQ